jgi:hypothetical protein
MTEAEWNSCTDPQKMLEWLRHSGRASERKLRLFAVACCRRIWHLLTDERSRNTVEMVEQYADERATVQELNTALTGATQAMRFADAADPGWSPDYWAASAAVKAAGDAEAATGTADDAAYAVHASAGSSSDSSASSMWATECQAQADLLRDLFGDAFRYPVLHRSWLRWNDRTVVRIAQAIHDDRRLPEGNLDNGYLAILADALEEAGCTDAELLGHLRAGGTHVRGCFALDAILVKS